MAPSRSRPAELITDCRTSLHKDLLTVKFDDGMTFSFHAQWLHDARCDNGPSRDAESAFCQQNSTVRIQAVRVAVGQGVKTTVDVTWDNGTTSQFPAVWLRVLAPLVAKSHGRKAAYDSSFPEGWLVKTLRIPEFSYHEIFSEELTSEEKKASTIRILDNLLHESAPGIVKIVGLPAPNIEDERNKKDTIVTQVLKQMFGSVFVHPRRGSDKTFNVASHHEGDTRKGIGLPNYNTNQVLLPHVDHAHYTHPIQVQGWYGLEGESENTFVSALAVLKTLREETPDLFEQLRNAPMAVGRHAHFYDPPMYQGTVDTAITMCPGNPDQFKRVRWHPHLTGSLLASFDKFHEARLAHQKFQEIMRRDTHQLKVQLKPGDLYVWNNFTVLHGRERVLEVPRTGVGQTVPEQVVNDTYRSLLIGKLKDHIDEKWLVHMPTPQLYDLVKLFGGWTG